MPNSFNIRRWAALFTPCAWGSVLLLCSFSNVAKGWLQQELVQRLGNVILVSDLEENENKPMIVEIFRVPNYFTVRTTFKLYVFFIRYLCCRRSSLSRLKINKENARWRGDIPVTGSIVWQMRLEAWPMDLSFLSTNMHSSCINDSWYGSYLSLTAKNLNN